MWAQVARRYIEPNGMRRYYEVLHARALKIMVLLARLALAFAAFGLSTASVSVTACGTEGSCEGNMDFTCPMADRCETFEGCFSVKERCASMCEWSRDAADCRQLYNCTWGGYRCFSACGEAMTQGECDGLTWYYPDSNSSSPLCRWDGQRCTDFCDAFADADECAANHDSQCAWIRCDGTTTCSAYSADNCPTSFGCNPVP